METEDLPTNINQYFFAIRHGGMTDEDEIAFYVLISPNAEDLYDDDLPIEDTLIEYGFHRLLEGTFEFIGSPSQARASALSTGMVESPQLAVFNGVGSRFYNNDGQYVELSEYEVELADPEAAIDDENYDDDGENPGDIVNPGFGPAVIQEGMTQQDIINLARERMTTFREEYETTRQNNHVNVDIVTISRYDSDWDKSLIFKGYNYRIVLVDDESIIRRMAIIKDVSNKLSSFLNEDEYIVQINDDTDELEVYLKTTRAIISWKMEDTSFFNTGVVRIEQHEG